MNPPEDVTCATDSLPSFTKDSDVYAFAMTVLEVNIILCMSLCWDVDEYQRIQIFTGQIPYYPKNDNVVIYAVVKGDRPELPTSVKEQNGLGELVQECWHQEPRRRPSSWEVDKRLNASKPKVYITMVPRQINSS